jgi:hypothetical protein
LSSDRAFACVKATHKRADEIYPRYGEKLESVVLPTVLLEPRFRGSIRKLKYKDTKSEQPRVQDMMAYKVNTFSVIFRVKLGADPI